MRKWIAALLCTFCVVGVPAASKAQSTERPPRIAWLSFSSLAGNADLVQGFRDMLRRLGYVDGKTIVVEYRFAEGRTDRLKTLVTELVRLKADVLVTPGTQATLAAKEFANGTPIVMVTVADPVATGLVASLAKPGGNVTGSSAAYADLAPKAIDLLREASPKVARIAYLDNLDNPAARAYAKQLTTAAKVLGVALTPYSATNPDGVDTRLAEMSKAQLDALVVGGDAVLRTRRERIVEYAARRRLPAVYTSSDYADEGGFMAYGPSRSGMGRQAAVYVDKILKGAKPGELPVEQPTTFELVINRKSADALGLRLPPSLLIRADRVVD